MPRWAAHQDSTHQPVVKALRAVGASVHRLISADHGSGAGMPDLIVGFRGRTFLLEVKGPKTAIDAAQLEWHASWKGTPVVVVRTPLEALQAIGAIRRAG
jgi:Holliday junction resolvase